MPYINTRSVTRLGKLPGGGGFVLPGEPPDPPVVVDPDIIEPPVVIEPDIVEPPVVIEPDIVDPDIVDPGIVDPPPVLPPPGNRPEGGLTYSRPPFPTLTLPGNRPEGGLTYSRPPGSDSNPVNWIDDYETAHEGWSRMDYENNRRLLSDLVKVKPIIISGPGQSRAQADTVVDVAGIPGWAKIALAGIGLFIFFNSAKTEGRRVKRRPRRKRRR